MNRVVRWVIRSLFAPVTGYAGAVASTLGFFLAFLPLHSLQIPLLFAFSLLLRLNIIALFLGMLITTFIPNIRDLPVLDLRFLEDFGLFPELLTNVQLSPSIVAGIFGGLIGLVCYAFFLWFYNLGLKKREQHQEHVFLDPGKRRWSIIKRISVGFTVFIVLVSSFFIESLYTNPEIPELQLKNNTAEIEPILSSFSEDELASQIQKTAPSPLTQENIGLLNKKQLTNKQEIYGFYVNWDEKSKTSFKNNTDSLTAIVPEWLQLTPSLTLKTSTDQSIVTEAKAHDVKILPLVNNFINNKWDGDILHRLFTTPGAEDLFIKKLLAYVRTNDFDGINIDFEAIHQEDKAHFTRFMEKVSEAFHQHNLMVTVSVPPMNNSFDYASIATIVDRMFVMLYDQHNSMSKPGPIASFDWVKDTLYQLDIPSEKLIVSLGNYGYDWEENSQQPASAMTFGDIMNLGVDTNLQIHWNKQAGNPYLRYKKNGKNQIVLFLDAAAFYNQMKLSIASGSKGSDLAPWF